MKSLVFKTNSSLAPVFIRLFLALILFPHGAQKLLGWFGGSGFDNSMTWFTETAGLPRFIGLLVIIIEFFGPIALVLGFATRLWSFTITVLMTGIILTSFSQYFFMNWFGKQSTEGMEFFLLVIGMSLSLTYSGAGSYSIDALIDRKIKSTGKGTGVTLALKS